MLVFDFPDRINEFVVDDALFARAYEIVPDTERALLKTCIARLFEWYGPAKVASTRTSREWASGLDSVQYSQPADYAVILFDDTLLSPVRLLAAVVAALSCGVKRVLAVRLSTNADWPFPVLTGLELAGQELVVDMTREQVQEMLAEFDEIGASGVVLGIDLPQGVFRSMRFPSNRINFHCLRFDRQAAVYMDGEQPFDLEALSFAHPDVSFDVYGLETPFPSEQFTHVSGGFSEVLKTSREVAYIPAAMVDKALERVHLILGPGQEGCWVWPQLRPEHFHFHSTAWTIGA